ncbi:hypothetical protein AKG33_01100 [Dichelobacter nodosus]|nr:hypothetical protein AKG33_01100 [Dichelobacter nodosus]
MIANNKTVIDALTVNLTSMGTTAQLDHFRDATKMVKLPSMGTTTTNQYITMDDYVQFTL